ncbi:MAG: NAD(P)-dependent oxidoreductase, partial [Ilumatobacter sp.]
YTNRRRVAADVEQELGARAVELDELIATSDVVSLNCPHTPETHHLLDSLAFQSMRDDAFVVNTARGAVIDEAALVEALDTRQIAGAGLDVYENEPDVHPGLLGRDDVVLLPHLGSATRETRGAMAELAARNVLAVLAGEAPPTPIN